MTRDPRAFQTPQNQRTTQFPHGVHSEVHSAKPISVCRIAENIADNTDRSTTNHVAYTLGGLRIFSRKVGSAAMPITGSRNDAALLCHYAARFHR